MHRQIYGALRRFILDGQIPQNTLLPSTRSLAEDLKVGRNTVIAAYDQLLAEGFIEARAGSGTWVAPIQRDRPRASLRPRLGMPQKLSRRGQTIVNGPQPPRNAGVINFHPGVPETASFPFSIWSSLLVRNARSRDENLLGYISFAGHPGLRQAIASTISLSRGINCTADQVIIVTGAQAALDLVSRVLMDEGDHVWMEEPGYLGAKSAFLASGAKLAPLKVDRRGWHLADPDLPPPRLIYVTPSCQWPFGTIMRIEERLQLLDIAERNGAWIVEDDYDGEYRFHGRPVPALRGLDHADRVVYIGSFGKTLIPALRIGYLIVPRELSVPFDRAVSITGQFAPLILQATVNDFITQGYFATHLKRMRRLYARRQANFVKLCRDHLTDWITVSENDSGMQLLASFVRPYSDSDVVAAALKEGLDVQGISINYHSSEPEHGLLLGYAAMDERQILRAVLALRAAFVRLDRS
ncbi:PLP-dependent aminotransferase family protein [Mesorhizobium sp. M00.F.Ca.ET.186.01.1.1]|nr:PLP-dependent aminotransferase family protein [bacterium M00.F.Ca.ET.205.01.1.1]TGU53179.1 PLP-dependent aminotransferase family protein [bacterium M00.F.Ca.ET.152.01.1.1]TGV36147.1 PLP-dependent aminotransferase family protein [Mesorhizobium sp. M00.F.Ca.ET.186.01.1.1]TGZ43732.1 PLP-dependent aminotransferase family protein [bacterium M00.F.Ca.ET.162.01.1.1]